MAEWIAEYKYKRLDEIHNVINDVYSFKCSSCGWKTGQQGIEFQFCPRCGERMKNANNPRVVPMSVLEDIKAELNELKSHYMPSSGVEWGIKMCLEIIDNHMESEDNNVETI